MSDKQIIHQPISETNALQQLKAGVDKDILFNLLVSWLNGLVASEKGKKGTYTLKDFASSLLVGRQDSPDEYVKQVRRDLHREASNKPDCFNDRYERYLNLIGVELFVQHVQKNTVVDGQPQTVVTVTASGGDNSKPTAIGTLHGDLHIN